MGHRLGGTVELGTELGTELELGVVDGVLGATTFGSRVDEGDEGLSLIHI